CNDLVAIGLMTGSARAGLVPGRDVSVTGYDDLEEAAIATPALTTVWNGQSEVGRSAARALLDKLSGSHEPDGVHLIKPEMSIRQSTGPLKPHSDARGEGARKAFITLPASLGAHAFRIESPTKERAP